MVVGNLLMAGLMLMVGTGADEVTYVNQQNIKIPLIFPPATRSNIAQVTLFVSTDEGQTWQQHANCGPDQEALKFYAPRDGMYWFHVQVTDQKGKCTPADLSRTSPAQKVVVDMLRPQLRIVSAERQGEEVVVAWEIQEEHPDLATLRLEYRTPDAPAALWYTAPVEPKLIGHARFPLHNPGEVSIRMNIQDLARNPATAEARIPAASGVTTASLTSTTAGAAPATPAMSPTTPQPLAIGGSTTGADKTPLLGGPPAVKPPGESQPPAPFSGPALGNEAASEGTKRSVATSENHDKETTGVGASVPLLPRNKLPALQVVKNREVTLEYKVDKVGPSGVGEVELWLTKDDGEHWQRYAKDDPGAKIAIQSGSKQQRTVELPGEGLFGLSLVVRSRAGLGKTPPKPGDAPQLRIEVDLTPPVAKLFSPTPHPSRRDSLVFTWEAHDPRHPALPARPITLQWAERKGEWQTIAANLANSGRHVWQLPPRVPDRVYLRMLVRDAAGNEAVAEFEEPQLVDLSEPEGTILGVVGKP